MPGEQERDASENPEAAVDQTPWKWNATDGAGDKGKRNDSGTGDQPEGDNPFVAHGVDIWTYETSGDDHVRKCEPVGAISQKWIERVCSAECSMDPLNPRQQPGEFRNRPQPTYVKERNEPAQLRFKRKGRDAAEDQSDDEDGEQKRMRRRCSDCVMDLNQSS